MASSYLLHKGKHLFSPHQIQLRKEDECKCAYLKRRGKSLGKALSQVVLGDQWKAICGYWTFFQTHLSICPISGHLQSRGGLVQQTGVALPLLAPVRHTQDPITLCYHSSSLVAASPSQPPVTILAAPVSKLLSH